MKKKSDQARLNRILVGSVVVLAAYSVALTWWTAATYFDTKRSLEFLYTNVEWHNPTNQ